MASPIALTEPEKREQPLSPQPSQRIAAQTAVHRCSGSGLWAWWRLLPSSCGPNRPRDKRRRKQGHHRPRAQQPRRRLSQPSPRHRRCRLRHGTDRSHHLNLRPRTATIARTRAAAATKKSSARGKRCGIQAVVSRPLESPRNSRQISRLQSVTQTSLCTSDR